MSLILFCVIGAIASVAVYLIARQLRRFSAWAMRQAGPRERVGVFIVLAALLGAVVGGLVHQPVTAAMTCHAHGESVIACLLPSKP
ncbi:MAG: hypothetical protein U1A22_01705 [Xanthomonadaceae bacterium]|nr:hypothetical protein [Xanthomonadaceae bacterium]